MQKSGVSSPDDSPLADLSLFRGLSADELTIVQQVVRPRTCSMGSLIFEQGQHSDGVAIVLSGTVKVYVRQASGAEVILNILGPNQVLGELSAIDQLGHSASVAAQEACRLWWLREEDFSRCRQTMPAINDNLVRILTHRLRRLSMQAEALALLDIAGRVAYQLLAFAQEYGETNAHDDVLIPLRLTQHDLAGLIGASRERVNRALCSFKRHNVISIASDYRITIHNFTALQKRCEIYPVASSDRSIAA